MRISELVRMLEEVKKEAGDLEIYADHERHDDAVMEIELAEFRVSLLSPETIDSQLMVLDVWPQSEDRNLL